MHAIRRCLIASPPGAPFRTARPFGGRDSAGRRHLPKLIKNLREQRNGALAELTALEAGRARSVRVPTADEARRQLAELDQLLTTAAAGNSDENAGRAREVIKLLTGGRINLYQQGERPRHGGWLQGRFSLWLRPYLVRQALGGGGVIDTALNQAVSEISIDYREQGWREQEAQQAKELHDQGLLNKEIAVRLGCGRNWVTKLLQGWFGARGQVLPDGRKRRASLVRKQVDPAAHERRAEEAKALGGEGLADVQIAARLNCSPFTVVRPWNIGTVPAA